jgi:hypothetical protein
MTKVLKLIRMAKCKLVARWLMVFYKNRPMTGRLFGLFFCVDVSLINPESAWPKEVAAFYLQIWSTLKWNNANLIKVRESRES